MMKRTITIAACVALIGAALYAANEITVNATLKVDNGGFSSDRNVSALRITQNAQGSSHVIQEIATNAAVAVTVASDVTAKGLTFCRNITTNSTRYVVLGPVDASTNLVPFVRLNASEVACFRLQTNATVYALAYIGACRLEFWTLQN